NSIQASQRADEYRAYLRQYPQGRFVALAQARVAAFSATAPAAAAVATAPPTLPRVGDSWRYKVQDQFRFGDLFVTTKADAVRPQGISEAWTTTADAKVRSIVAPLEPGFVALPEWTATPAEFAPYLQAAGGLRAGARLPEVSRRVDQWTVPLKASVEGEEE